VREVSAALIFFEDGLRLSAPIPKDWNRDRVEALEKFYRELDKSSWNKEEGSDAELLARKYDRKLEKAGELEAIILREEYEIERQGTLGSSAGLPESTKQEEVSDDTDKSNKLKGRKKVPNASSGGQAVESIARQRAGGLERDKESAGVPAPDGDRV
jgi:hypothetical protein